MQIKEFLVFKDVFLFLQKIEKWHLENESPIEIIINQIKKVESSSNSSYGIINKTSKKDMLAQLKTQELKIEGTLRTGEELLKLAYSTIYNREIELVKQKKIQRQSRLLRDFGTDKIKRVEGELAFWKTVRDSVSKNGQIN